MNRGGRGVGLDLAGCALDVRVALQDDVLGLRGTAVDLGVRQRWPRPCLASVASSSLPWTALANAEAACLMARFASNSASSTAARASAHLLRPDAPP